MSSKQSVRRGLSRGEARKRLPQQPRPCDPLKGLCCSSTSCSEIAEAILTHRLLHRSQSAAAVCNNPPKPAQGRTQGQPAASSFPDVNDTQLPIERRPPTHRSRSPVEIRPPNLTPPSSAPFRSRLPSAHRLALDQLGLPSQPERSGSGHSIDEGKKLAWTAFLFRIVLVDLGYLRTSRRHHHHHHHPQFAKESLDLFHETLTMLAPSTTAAAAARRLTRTTALLSTSAATPFLAAGPNNSRLAVAAAAQLAASYNSRRGYATPMGPPPKGFRQQPIKKWDEDTEGTFDKLGKYFLMTEMARGMYVLLEQFFRPP